MADMRLVSYVFDPDTTRNEQYRHLLARYDFMESPIRIGENEDWQHHDSVLHADLAIIYVGTDGSGFDIAEALIRIKSTALLLFVGDPAFAFQAFEYAPIDYLPPQFSVAQFERAVQRLLAQRPYPASYRPIDMRTMTEIGVRSGSRFHKLKLEDVRFIESLNRNAVFHMKDDSQICAKGVPLSYIESILCYSGFLRVHQSFIVRFESIVCAELADNKANYQLYLDGIETPIPVSRQKKDDLLKMLYNQNLLIF